MFKNFAEINFTSGVGGDGVERPINVQMRTTKIVI